MPRGAAHVDHRADPAQQFLARRRQAYRRFARSQANSSGCSSSASRPAATQVARRVAAGIDQQQEEQQELDVVELAAVDLGGEQLGGQIVGRPRALLGDDPLRVLEHLHHRRALRALGHGLRRGVDRFGELIELAPVVERNAHQLGDDVGRHLAGDVGDEIAFAALDHLIDDLARQRFDAGAQRGGRAVNSRRIKRRNAVCCGGSIISIIL